MNTFFNENLGSLIKLENKKIVNKSNKKLISTSIFLPELPSVTFKTSIYILGTIKLIETFKKDKKIINRKLGELHSILLRKDGIESHSDRRRPDGKASSVYK